jgi:hypothetical protein
VGDSHRVATVSHNIRPNTPVVIIGHMVGTVLVLPLHHTNHRADNIDNMTSRNQLPDHGLDIVVANAANVDADSLDLGNITLINHIEDNVDYMMSLSIWSYDYESIYLLMISYFLYFIKSLNLPSP